MKYICKPYVYTQCFYQGAELKDIVFTTRYRREAYCGFECRAFGFLSGQACKCCYVLQDDGKLTRLVTKKHVPPKNGKCVTVGWLSKDLITHDKVGKIGKVLRQNKAN